MEFSRTIASMAVVLGVVLAAGYAVGERARLERTVEDIERAQGEEERLHRVNFSLAQAIVAANEGYHRRDASRDFLEAIVAAEAVQTGIESLTGLHPQLGAASGELSAHIARLRGSGERERLLDARQALHGAAAAMDEATSQLRERKKALNGLYRARYERVAMTCIGLGIVGALLFGALLLLFLSRLGWDLKKLPLAVTRSEEMGALMRAVNRMQQKLREHEAQVELGRQQQFHREKMAAVGGLAAQIAHEINNPIAAIVGVAEAMCETQGAANCAGRCAPCQPRLIVEQARRASAITRQIAEFSSPQPAEPQLIDLNGLIEKTCAFVRYDKRFGALALELELDRQLPAVNAVGDHLTQVLMNLLINAADAVSGTGRKGRIVVATRCRRDEVVLTVSDNGTGMDAQTRARAFEEFFTTKPQGRGFGLGLSLSRRLLRETGAEIELDSRPGAGTVVTVRLPRTRTAQAA